MKIVRSIIFLLICAGLIWLIIVFFGKLLSSGNKTQLAAPKLSSYAKTDARAQLYIDGPVRVDQDHWALRITVDRTQSQIELISGYEGSVVRQEVFPNNENSYTNFLKGLEAVGFTKGSQNPALADERGRCPLRNRFVYRLEKSGTDVFRYWSTSCGAGTFEGSPSAARQLFQRQVPVKVYNDFTRKISIQ